MDTKLVARLHDFVRHRWRSALRWREKFELREEALHLALAGGVALFLLLWAIHYLPQVPFGVPPSQTGPAPNAGGIRSQDLREVKGIQTARRAALHYPAAATRGRICS